MRMTTLTMVAAALLTVSPVAAQQVPAPADVLGYELGERFTDHGAILRYIDALIAAAPERTRLEQYGETVEGRPLVQLVIGRADYLDRLDQILATNAELTRLETTVERARQIVLGSDRHAAPSIRIHGDQQRSCPVGQFFQGPAVGLPRIGMLDPRTQIPWPAGVFAALRARAKDRVVRLRRVERLDRHPVRGPADQTVERFASQPLEGEVAPLLDGRSREVFGKVFHAR